MNSVEKTEKQNMPKIAIVGNQAFSLINFRGDLIRDLVAYGYQVYAMAPDYDAKTRSEVISMGATPCPISMSRLGTNPISDLKTVLSVYRAFRRYRPDVFLGYAAKPAIYGSLAAWLSRVPRRYAMIEGLGYVFMPSAVSTIGRRLLKGTVLSLFKLALARTHKAFFLNEDDIDDFVNLGVVTRRQAINIGGIGVDLNAWQAQLPHLVPITFTFVGRLLKDKGILDFVGAARVVKERHPDVRFVILGGVDENPESVTHDQVTSWVRDGVVEWLGHIPVQEPLKKTSVFVLPSYYREGVPRSTQEAMALARPVITTNSVGCRDTVVEGYNGFLIPPKDRLALVMAMEKFILTPQLVVTMGAASRRLAEDKFDVRVVNAKLIAEFEHI